MTKPFTTVRAGYTVHFTADGERALCNMSVTHTANPDTLNAEPNPGYFHSSPSAVNCPECLRHLHAAQVSAEEARQRQAERWAS